MTQVRDVHRAASSWLPSVSSSSQDVIVPENALTEEAGSSDRTRTWQEVTGKLRQRIAGALYRSILEASKKYDLLLRLGDAVYAIDAGSVDTPPWYALRSSLAASAVEIRGMVEVRSYLDSHADMFDVTEKICKTAREEFDTEAFVTLQVYRDPEIEDEYLLLRVRLRSYAPDTMTRIRSVSERYENELGNKSGSILVTTDFRPIR